ncbi:MAG: hypothetical protein QW478_02545 [Candidatus Micrarchaeaceae archaeon]
MPQYYILRKVRGESIQTSNPVNAVCIRMLSNIINLNINNCINGITQQLVNQGSLNLNNDFTITPNNDHIDIFALRNSTLIITMMLNLGPTGKSISIGILDSQNNVIFIQRFVPVNQIVTDKVFLTLTANTSYKLYIFSTDSNIITQDVGNLCPFVLTSS